MSTAASGGPPPAHHNDNDNQRADKPAVPVCRCHGLAATYPEWWLLLHKPQAAIVVELAGQCDDCEAKLAPGDDVWLVPSVQKPETAASHAAKPRLVCTPCRRRTRGEPSPHHERHTASAVLAAWEMLPASLAAALNRGERTGAIVATRRHTA